MTLTWTGQAVLEADLGDGTSFRIFPMVEPTEYELVRWGSIHNPIDCQEMGRYPTVEQAKAAAEDRLGGVRRIVTLAEALDATQTGEEFGQVLMGLFDSLDHARQQEEE